MSINQHKRSWRDSVCRNRQDEKLLRRPTKKRCRVSKDIAQTATIIFAFCYIFGVLQKSQQILQQSHRHLESKPQANKPKQKSISIHKLHEVFHAKANHNVATDHAATIKQPKQTKYIVFNGRFPGQGIGNIMNGLLGAHLLGEEFNRVVCTMHYESFQLAFELKEKTQCEHLGELPKEDRNNKISLVNFSKDPNECELKRKLASDVRVIYMYGNTYPTWCHVQKDFFAKFYRPTQHLLQAIPWKEPPSVVVHLRQGDSNRDFRKGLDVKTLEALGETLPRDTFLVTNQVKWYKLFEEKYGWKNPGWGAVKHSALGVVWEKEGTSRKSIKGTIRRGDSKLTFKSANESNRILSESERSDLQLWSDFYTIYSAKKFVYHTHSDFSSSPIHWRGVESKRVWGLDENGKLMLGEESWIVEGDAKRLVDRTGPELKHCDRKSRWQPVPKKKKN